MNDEQREITGFLCRWSLLGLVALTVLAAAWAAALATEAISAELRTEVILPDGVARAGQDVWLVGYLRPPLPYSAPSAMVYRGEDGRRVGPAWARFDRVHWFPSGGGPGLERMDFRGQPYGPLALERRSVRLLVVLPDEPLWLLDAVWAEQLSRRRRNELAGLSAQLDGRGAVALFHPGPVEAFAACRSALRRRGFQYAVLLDVTEDGDQLDPVHVLRRTSRRIRRWSHNRGVFVVTGDVELGISAAAEGFETHLLPPPGTDVPASDKLTVHNTLGEMKDFLAPAPIP
jgi:hypothetical protein